MAIDYLLRNAKGKALRGRRNVGSAEAKDLRGTMGSRDIDKGRDNYDGFMTIRATEMT